MIILGLLALACFYFAAFIGSVFHLNHRAVTSIAVWSATLGISTLLIYISFVN